MKRHEVESLVALHLGNVIGLGYWFISFPPRDGEQQLVSGYLGRLTDIVGKDGLKGACRKIIYAHAYIRLSFPSFVSCTAITAFFFLVS